MTTYPIFSAVGVEMEYMIVDRASLKILPISDEVLKAAAGEIVSEVEMGELSWSNELVSHVIELKTNGPAPGFGGLAALFQRDARRVDDILAPHGARLMPTAAHPFMDPLTETKLWAHEYSAVYEAYDRIFGCKGHGWSNLQSTHLNLPFTGDEEFGRLHAAIRAVLPVMPALTASSPILEGRPTGLMDSRMEFYRTNSRAVPSVAGRVVPECAYTKGDYDRLVMFPMFADIAPHDPEGILRDEFLNARGAIARFGRGSIEIRVLDIQECPAMDLAAASLILAAVRALDAAMWRSHDELRAWPVEPLHEILLACVRDAERAVIDNPEYLALFGMRETRATAGELWAHVAEAAQEYLQAPELEACRRVLLSQGCLARRIMRAAGSDPSAESIRETYRRLCDCLSEGAPFTA